MHVWWNWGAGIMVPVPCWHGDTPLHKVQVTLLVVPSEYDCVAPLVCLRPTPVSCIPQHGHAQWLGCVTKVCHASMSWPMASLYCCRGAGCCLCSQGVDFLNRNRAHVQRTSLLYVVRHCVRGLWVHCCMWMEIAWGRRTKRYVVLDLLQGQEQQCSHGRQLMLL